MYYGNIKKNDIANGVGVRVSLFVSGCRHHCKNCFNKEAWDFNYGKPFTEEVVKEILDACDHDHIEGLSLLGGEPFEKENRGGLISLVKQFKERFPNKTIWCYSGFLLDDEIMASGDEDAMELLSYIDVIVDGRFVEELKNMFTTVRAELNTYLKNISPSVAIAGMGNGTAFSSSNSYSPTYNIYGPYDQSTREQIKAENTKTKLQWLRGGYKS